MKYIWKKINFTDEIIEYRQSLYTEAARNIVAELLPSMQSRGRDVKSFYFAICKLGNRNIIQCTNLFSYQPFIEEVNIAVAEYDAGKELHVRLERQKAILSVLGNN